MDGPPEMRGPSPVPPRIDALTGRVVDSAYQVHRTLGPGLLEEVYVECLEAELEHRGITVRREVPVPVLYRGKPRGHGYRLDLLVEEQVVIEVKACEATLPVHEAQLLTYLELAEKPVGFLLNFHVSRLKEGLRRFVR